MVKMSVITDDELKAVRDGIMVSNGGKKVRAWEIRDALSKQSIQLDESTIRGRFIEMGLPLSGLDGINVRRPAGKPEEAPAPPKPKVVRPIEPVNTTFEVLDEMKGYIPDENMVAGYIKRSIDDRLALHYNTHKFPMTQGKQGTGKTFSHIYYAFKHQLPFFLFSCYEDMKLKKYFGDKTMENMNLVFREGILIKAIAGPCVILWDEANYISNTLSVDFHPIMQNRELFVKDADNGKGKIYKLHPECRMGFAQNPKSSKYIGGNIKPSNFLGRCTYLTYPDFTKDEIVKFVEKKYPQLNEDERVKFVEFYFACMEAIEQSEIPVDISIRQLNNVIDLYVHGMPLEHAIEDGMTSILEAISQPKNKEAFYRLAQAVFEDLMKKSINENA
jgi:MoxR-like ATPase